MATTMTQDASLKILLLLPSSTALTFPSYATDVCQELSSKYGLCNVTIRSAMVPIERLLRSCSNVAEPSLWVLLGEESTFPMQSCPVPTLLISPEDQDTSATALTIAKFCGLASDNARSNVQRAVGQDRQKQLVNDAQFHTQSPMYTNAIASSFDQHLQITGDLVSSSSSSDGVLPDRSTGKVRDRYVGTSRLALVTTDRQSGFDRMLALVPFKGAVLNLTSAFWFDKTKHIIPNHLLAVPHPNVSIVKKCKPFPIEFVVRSYVTGSTSTSIWKNYQNGVRTYCGHELPEGLTKNQKLWENLLTPTTKEEEHDRPISLADIVSEGWMTQDDLDVCGKAALAVFSLGQQVAADRGLILVDTKYEFGKDESTGEILLIDEVHTPDSSRYWLASTYEERVAHGKEPDNIDKEFLRLWFRDHCDPYKDEVIPEAPRDLVLELSRRYITLYEMITWNDFEFETDGGEAAIREAIRLEIA